LFVPDPQQVGEIEVSLEGLANYEPIGTMRDLGGFLLSLKLDLSHVDTNAGFTCTDISGVLAGSMYQPIIAPWTNVCQLDAQVMAFSNWSADRLDSVPFAGETLLGYLRTVLSFGLWIGFFAYIRSRISFAS
jgi:hypothetical protein